jgi:hypothetical protein
MTAVPTIPDRPLSPEALADVQAVSEALAARKPVDPEVARRVQARSAEARKNLLTAKGVQNIGVELIRELRGELPNL